MRPRLYFVSMKNNFRKFCALLAWLTISGQYILLLNAGTYGGIAGTSLAYFGFFTVTTNILVALAFSVPLLKSNNRLRNFFERQSVRGAIALYILVVAIIYYGLLAKDHNPEGLSAFMNIGLHFILPVLYLTDWTIFAQKDKMRFKSAPYWTLYPLAYGLFNLIRGHITGFYPYPFLDVSKIGVGAVSLNMLGFAIFYGIGALAFIFLGRVLTKD